MQAEVMYRVALANSQGDPKLEPMAACNYATFLYRQRQQPDRAYQHFSEGCQK